MIKHYTSIASFKVAMLLKDSLHIPEICKENGETFTDDMDKAATKYHCAIHEVSPQWIGEIENAFKAGANWQREQFHDACYQCEKNYDTVFYRGEKHAIKMLKEEGIGGNSLWAGNRPYQHPLCGWCREIS